MITGTRTRTCDTKVDGTKNSVSKKTIVTFDYTGCTGAHLAELAERQAVVQLQNGWRKNGIPDTLTVKMIEVGSGRRQLTGEELQAAAIAQAMADPKYRADMLAKLTALGQVSGKAA